MIQSIVAGIVMIVVLVVIHEFGHFIVAKLFGVGVPVFSIGMGPRLFGVHWGGTDYRVSLLPVGGYVQMSGADPFGEEDADSWVDPALDFMRKPVWQRLLVMLAGPAANLILPFVIFTAVLMLGEPQADNSIGTLMPNTPAERAGFTEGDQILSVAGEPVEVWADLVMALDDHAVEDVVIEVLRGGQLFSLTLPAGSISYTIDNLVDMRAIGLWSARLSTRIGVDGPNTPAALAGLQTGDAITKVDGVAIDTLSALRAALAPGQSHTVAYLRGDTDSEEIVEHQTTLVPTDWRPRSGDLVVDPWGLVPVMLVAGELTEDSPAEAAGVQTGDRIYSVDGVHVRAWSELMGMVGRTVPSNYGPDSQPRVLELVVVRGGELIEMSFAPRVERDVVRGEVRWRPIMGIGAYPDVFTAAPRVVKYYSLTAAMPRAFEEGSMVFTHTIRVLTNLFTNKLKPSESVGGPLQIFRMAGRGAELGIFAFVRLIGTISFSLGIINLLPVPVLDGGQIFFYLVEGIRGRPLSLELREKVQMIGVLALVAIMIMVTVMDVGRYLEGG